MNSSHMVRMMLLFTISLLLLAVTGTKDATTISKSKEDHQIQTFDEQSKNQPSHHQSTNKEGHENTGIRHDVSSQTATTSTFSYVGSSQTYTLPSAGCSSLQIMACGAAGNTHLSMPMPFHSSYVFLMHLRIHIITYYYTLEQTFLPFLQAERAVSPRLVMVPVYLQHCSFLRQQHPFM